MGSLSDVTLDKRIKSHVTFTEHTHISQICQPLEILGITGFYYVRRAHDNSKVINLTTFVDWAEFYLKNLYQEKYSPDTIKDHLFTNEGISLWELNQQNLIWQEAKNCFNVGNGMVIYQNKKDYREIFCFHSTRENYAMNYFFVNNIDLLKKFASYFLEKADPIIKKGAANELVIPKKYHFSPKPDNEQVNLVKSFLCAINSDCTDCEELLSGLSKREIECLNYLSNGKSAKEIGSLLNISNRTVEAHIYKIKHKLHCTKTSQLAYIAAKYKTERSTI